MGNVTAEIIAHADSELGEKRRWSKRVWRLSRPVRCRYVETEYVVTSAIEMLGSIRETYVFRCDIAGNVLGWSELPGSIPDAIDHEAAIAGFLQYINAWEA